MAGVALAAFAHGGMLAGVFLLAPASSSGLGPKDDVFLVTLVEEPVTAPAQVPEPPAQEPPPSPPEKEEIVPSTVAEVPAAPAPAPEAAMPAENVPVAPASDPPAEATASEQESGPAFVTLAPDSSPLGAELAPAAVQAASSGVAGDGKAMRDAYLRDVRLQLARHAPRGVRGAGNCEVEFRLSRGGEVIFVGIQTSSGSRLYDRRCLKAVTSAVPFPQAPDGAVEADLRFTIMMQQKR
ncbi:TonB family protein [uncultured Hyphomonas sp.]|uniref:TonB family protein n=1 Tax=uncultured Hyphomonas sp. TaxID=225298 RepID=UPI00374A3BBE